MKRGAKYGKTPKVTESLRRYPSIYRVRSPDPTAEKLLIRRLRGFAGGWLARGLRVQGARWQLLIGPRSMRGSEHAAAGRSFDRRAGCFGLGLLLGRIRRRHVSLSKRGWLSSLMTQQPGDSAGHVSHSKRGWRGNCDYAKFLGFCAKNSKIHNFRIRAPFLTFFICTRS